MLRFRPVDSGMIKVGPSELSELSEAHCARPSARFHNSPPYSAPALPRILLSGDPMPQCRTLNGQPHWPAPMASSRRPRLGIKLRWANVAAIVRWPTSAYCDCPSPTSPAAMALVRRSHQRIGYPKRILDSKTSIRWRASLCHRYCAPAQYGTKRRSYFVWNRAGLQASVIMKA